MDSSTILKNAKNFPSTKRKKESKRGREVDRARLLFFQIVSAMPCSLRTKCWREIITVISSNLSKCCLSATGFVNVFPWFRVISFHQFRVCVCVYVCVLYGQWISVSQSLKTEIKKERMLMATHGVWVILLTLIVKRKNYKQTNCSNSRLFVTPFLICHAVVLFFDFPLPPLMNPLIFPTYSIILINICMQVREVC